MSNRNSKFFTAFWMMLFKTLCFNIVYHFESNAQIEKTYQTLDDMLWMYGVEGIIIKKKTSTWWSLLIIKILMLQVEKTCLKFMAKNV
jgi:hypothetical protein